MTHKILVSDKLSEDGLAVFTNAGFEVDHLPEITQDEIKECIGEYSAWVIRSRSRATADIIENATKLQVIGRAGVGIDNVDTVAATQRGIIVMNTPGGNTTSTAEHTISMLLSLARKIPQAYISMTEGKWDKKSFMGVEVYGKTLGVMGLGRIGQEVVRRMKSFGMQVLGYDPFIPDDRMRQLGVESCTVDEICERADFITVHTPLSPETKDLINAARLSKMKKTVRIVNCARGGIINEDDLLVALKSGQIAGAALDVFMSEPIPADSDFRKLPNVVVTPHIAASTVEAQENVAIEVANQIVDVLKGGVVRNALNAVSVDPELLPVVGPWMDLADKMGAFLTQFRAGKAVKLTCRYSGPQLDISTSAITTAAVQGFVRPIAEGPVNFVNARQIVRDRGVEIIETHHSEVYQYENLCTVEVEYEDGSLAYISGTMFTSKHPRIVILNDKHIDAVPEGTLIVLENNDVPGIIGRVGTALGANNINIGQMTWGRTDEGTAMTVINVDGAVDDGIIEKLTELPDIKWVKLVRLS
ncbi:MAG: phosphoglycerate dehydrogenase [Candidatus Sumerlaeia bacterium]|nr:phosphoglycerate dehydrogenase [Candidatus Sumerlaeia bacterium]